MSGYEIASLTEIESVKAVGTLKWTPVRKHFGITAFGISAYTATEVGQDVVEEHTEERLGHEELYVVIAGRATFVLDGEEKDVPAGSAVFLRDPKVKRFARAEEPDTTVLAVGGKPGVARDLRLGVLLHRVRRRRRGSRSERSPKWKPGWPRSRTTRDSSSTSRASTVAGRLDEAALDRALELDPEFQKWADETRTWSR